jgi:hypothetical protein
VVNADFHALAVSNRFCDYNLFDAISAEGVQTESISISAYPEFTNYFINGNPRDTLFLDDLNDKNFLIYGKRFSYNNSWYLSSRNDIPNLDYMEIKTEKFPLISAYQIPQEFINTINDNIVSIKIPDNYFTIFDDKVIFITANEAGWTQSPPIISDLATHISNIVDSRLSGKNISNALSLYTTYNTGYLRNAVYNTGILERNPNVWCADLPKVLTCISPWNSQEDAGRAGTLISPRHIILAAHYSLDSDGVIVAFVDSNNNVITRTVAGRSSISGTDIQVCLLNSDVPDTINFAKVLPDNWQEYINTDLLGGLIRISNNNKIPSISTDHEEKMTVRNWSYEQPSNNYVGFEAPTEPKRLEFYEIAISGDSGNPVMLVINNEPVILTTFHFGGAGSGPSYTSDHNKNLINNAMTQLGGGYQLTEVDLSSFDKI